MPELPVAHSKKYMPEIQAKVKIDKGHYNDYSGFWFRTAEDVLEVVKPVLKEYDAYITLNDDVVSFDNGSRVYIKVTATVAFLDGSNVKAVGFSREPLNRPGFDESQLTGSSSSYARKTALSGLFAIDNAVTDADSDNKDTPPEKTEGKTDSKRGKRAKTDDKAKDKAESKLETYPTDKFKVDQEKWKKAVIAGKLTADDVLKKIKARYKMSASQLKFIRAMKNLEPVTEEEHEPGSGE